MLSSLYLISLNPDLKVILKISAFIVISLYVSKLSIRGVTSLLKVIHITNGIKRLGRCHDPGLNHTCCFLRG